MNLFTWLIVGHLVGDWLLQTDWMARYKRLRLVNRAVFVHCIVYTTSIGVVMWLAHFPAALESGRFALALGITFGSHWLIDAGNVPRLWGQLIGQSDLDVVRMMVDQTLHVLVLVLVAEVIVKGM